MRSLAAGLPSALILFGLTSCNLDSSVGYIEIKSAPPSAKAVEEHAPPTPHKRAAARTKDDFLARYLDMSAEFEARFKVKGWTDLVRKKCSAQLRK